MISGALRLGHFPKSKIDFESSFLKKYYIVTVLKKKFKRFDQYLKKSKNGFTIVNPKCNFAKARSSFLKKPKSLEYPLELGLRGSEARFSLGQLPPPPIMKNFHETKPCQKQLGRRLVH